MFRPLPGGGRSAPENGLRSCCSTRQRRSHSRRIRCGESGSAGSSGAHPCSAHSHRRSAQSRRSVRPSVQSTGLRLHSSIAEVRHGLPCPAALPPPPCPGLPATWKNCPDSRDAALPGKYQGYRRWQKYHPAHKFQPKPRRKGTDRAAAPSGSPPFAFPFNVTPFLRNSKLPKFDSYHFIIFQPPCTCFLPNGKIGE